MAATQDQPQQTEERSISSLVVEEGSMTFTWKAENGVQRRAILAWDGIPPSAFVGGPSGDARTVCGVACPTIRFETLDGSGRAVGSEVAFKIAHSRAVNFETVGAPTAIATLRLAIGAATQPSRSLE